MSIVVGGFVFIRRACCRTVVGWVSFNGLFYSRIFGCRLSWWLESCFVAITNDFALFVTIEYCAAFRMCSIKITFVEFLGGFPFLEINLL